MLSNLSDICVLLPPLLRLKVCLFLEGEVADTSLPASAMLLTFKSAKKNTFLFFHQTLSLACFFQIGAPRGPWYNCGVTTG